MDKELIKSRLMDYLYDELNELERKEVEQLLADDPEAQQELYVLQQTRKILSGLPSIEPATPVVKISSSHSIRRRWLPLAITAAAAAILLLLIATNVSVQTHDGGVVIAFGKVPPQQIQPIQPNVDENAIQAAIAVNNQLLFQQLDSIQRELKGQLVANQAAMQSQWTRQWSAKQVSYENQLKSLASAEFRKKYPELAAFIQDMQLQQQQEVRNLLTELWSNWQQVRVSDLKTIENHLAAINQNVELNRKGTEEMFKNLIGQANMGE